MSFKIVLITSILLSSRLVAQLDFQSDFSGSSPWNWDSLNAKGTAATTDISGSGEARFGEPAGGWAGGDGLWVSKTVSNTTGDSNGQLQFSFDFDVGTLTQGGSGFQGTLMEVSTSTGNGSATDSGGYIARVYAIHDTPNNRIRFTALPKIDFWAGSESTVTFITLDGPDKVVSLTMDLGVSNVGDDWTVDVLLSADYNGSTYGGDTPGSYSRTRAGYGGLDAIDAYELGIFNQGGDATGEGGMDNFNATVIPEPSTILLMGLSVMGLALFRRRF